MFKTQEVIKHDTISIELPKGIMYIDSIPLELEILKKLQGNVNILEILSHVIDYDERYLNIFVKKYPMDLHTRMIQYGTFSQEYFDLYVSQMIIAIRVCHRNRIVHRNVQPKSFKIDIDPESGLETIILCEFQHAQYLSNTSDVDGHHGMYCFKSEIKDLNHRYCAPLVFTGNYGYNEKVDYWSVGCIMFEMISGEPLFGRGVTKRNVPKAHDDFYRHLHDEKDFDEYYQAYFKDMPIQNYRVWKSLLVYGNVSGEEEKLRESKMLDMVIEEAKEMDRMIEELEAELEEETHPPLPPLPFIEEEEKENFQYLPDLGI